MYAPVEAATREALSRSKTVSPFITGVPDFTFISLIVELTWAYTASPVRTSVLPDAVTDSDSVLLPTTATSSFAPSGFLRTIMNKTKATTIKSIIFCHLFSLGNLTIRCIV